MIETRIHNDIFNKFPSFRRGIVVVKKMHNQGPSKALDNTLKEAVAEAAEHPIDLKADPQVTVWNEAHRQFGSNPNKFPPAHCALLKRVQKSGASIPFISKVVAIMNINSIQGTTPVGGDDLVDADPCLELRYATGDETFTPLGRPEIVEHPNPGEIIYVVEKSNEVMCRRWNWRNGHKTRITEDTHTMVMNIDALGENSDEKAIQWRDSVARMLEEYCEAEIETALLSPSEPSCQFDNGLAK
jgi:lysyl-tRNA synthetase class 2